MCPQVGMLVIIERSISTKISSESNFVRLNVEKSVQLMN